MSQSSSKQLSMSKLGIYGTAGNYGDMQYYPYYPAQQDLLPNTTITIAGYYAPVEEKFMVTKQMLVDNKFYIGSNDALKRNWGHKTLDEAISKATEMINAKDGKDDTVFIVQIIKVVKRPQAPVVVEDI